VILAVDLGSTSFKAGVFDPALRCLGHSAGQVEYRFGSDGAVEFSAAEAERCFGEAVAGAMKSAGIQPDRVRVLGIDSQAQTFTVVAEDGKAVTPFVSWQDSRAGSACEALKRESGMDSFGEHASFGEPIAALQIAQLRRIRDTGRGAQAGLARIMHLPSFLVWRMTGTNVVDENLAALSGMYSLALRSWWTAAMDATGVTASQLSEVVPVGAVGARTNERARDFGLPAGVPVVLAGNDQTAGAYGAGIHLQGGVLITLGTVQVVYVVESSLPPTAVNLVRGPYPGGKFYRMAVDSCGGRAVNWAKTVLSGCDTDEKFSAAAATAPAGCHGVVFEPEFPDGRGRWNRTDADSADKARAVIESLCRRMKILLGSIGPRSESDHILVAGGGSGSQVWMRILRETLGVRLAVAEGSSLTGAASLALQSVGGTK
jgi:xylulokinase